MIEVRFHGRGGQGAVVASQVLAEAAFLEGKDVQAFPFFGVERRGAPVTAFTKIDEKKILVKSQIYNPDYVVVLDDQLIGNVDVASGIKPEGMILINTSREPDSFDFPAKVVTVDATSIAVDHRLGSKESPIVNTSILGAFSKASGVVSIDSVIKAIKNKAPRKKEENATAAKVAYDSVITEG